MSTYHLWSPTPLLQVVCGQHPDSPSPKPDSAGIHWTDGKDIGVTLEGHWHQGISCSQQWQNMHQKRCMALIGKRLKVCGLSPTLPPAVCPRGVAYQSRTPLGFGPMTSDGHISCRGGRGVCSGRPSFQVYRAVSLSL